MARDAAVGRGTARVPTAAAVAPAAAARAAGAHQAQTRLRCEDHRAAIDAMPAADEALRQLLSKPTGR
jgi:hypothetical protein